MQNTNQTSKYKTDCKGICERLSGYCKGCGRTNEEIFDWIILSDDEKKAILAMPREDRKD
ncbi:DUF1289 domain-containing protein [Pseudoalteromonas sp. MMG010]|uniref:DUF1289 domain-containing protein n=1 Tax=Pseudoalteromonas sp. MMG010 TaxID=2822685 RepID=UPI001B3A3F9A|nr:DUF1289 domain-containing protein [Pseudoalteromonas sp. MMG010]MBQ4833406.1 DUF1289 domain-containing protein [Pseudoalteromonas sp. MMG010]